MTAAAASLSLVRRTDGPWICAQEVCERAGWSQTTFYRRAGELISRETDEIGPNGRRIREYLLASVPNLQPAVAAPKVTTLAPLGPLFSGVSAASSYPVILPNPEDQKQAAERMTILQPLLDFAADPRPFSHLVVNGKPVNSQKRLIEWLCAQHKNLSEPTLKRWKQRFLEGGFPALADRVRVDKGQSRWFAQNRNAAMLAAYLYLGDVDAYGNSRGTGQSVAFVHEQLRAQASTLGIDANDVPSYGTVRAFLTREISPAMRTLAREGKRAYAERMSPYITRMYTDVFANQVWVGDHMIHDREVANDLFEDAELGAPIRLRLSAMEDFRSRKIVGASWALEGSSSAIAATMLRGILEFGPPEMIYVDNGKDYRKVAKGAQRGFQIERMRTPDIAVMEQKGFLARLGIGVTHCIPHHPQSKGVERFFGTMHHYDSLGAQYTSGSPFTRPEATEEAMMRHRRLLKLGRVEESTYQLASTFILGALAWIEQYNDTPHSGAGMDGLTPNQVFDACRNPNQKPIPDHASLALLFCEYERREVRECAVRLRNRRYVPAAEDRAGWAAMHEANEGQVLIAFDPRDLEFAAALDLDGRFLAWLQLEQQLRFAPQDAETQRQIGDSMAMRRGLLKATRQTHAEIAAAARGLGARNGEEMLFAKLQLPASTAPVITQRKPRIAKNTAKPGAPMTPADVARTILEGK